MKKYERKWLSAIEIAKQLKEQFGLDANVVLGRYCVYHTENMGWNIVGEDGVPMCGYNTKEETIKKAVDMATDYIARKSNISKGAARIFLEAAEDE